MDVRDSSRAAARGRPPIRPSAALAAVICAAGALAAQLTVLAVVPPHWRFAASISMTALMLITLAVILIHTNPERRSRQQPQQPQQQLQRDDFRFGPPPGADEPSPHMRIAYELARRGVPAVWIAQHCDLPQALAELVVADANADAEGGDR